MFLQELVKTVYPPQCALCDTRTESDFALCGTCWSGLDLIEGPICDTCGAPVHADADDHAAVCDDCLTIARPWHRGRAALRYGGTSRRIILDLKHGDRPEIARTVAPLLLREIERLGDRSALLIPVPLHWTRLFQRKFNQSAVLARAVAELGGYRTIPDALVRPKKTASLDGRSRQARFDMLAGAIAPHPRNGRAIAGKHVILIDDVMTAGATFAAATEACMAAGATTVDVLALARAVKDN